MAKVHAATPCCPPPPPAHCAATKLAMPITQQLMVLLPPVAAAAVQTVLVVLTWNPAGYCNTPVSASAGQHVGVLCTTACEFVRLLIWAVLPPWHWRMPPSEPPPPPFRHVHLLAGASAGVPTKPHPVLSTGLQMMRHPLTVGRLRSLAAALDWASLPMLAAQSVAAGPGFGVVGMREAGAHTWSHHCGLPCCRPW